MKKILFLLVLVPTIAFGIQPKNQNIDDGSTFKMMETNILEESITQDTVPFSNDVEKFNSTNYIDCKSEKSFWLGCQYYPFLLLFPEFYGIQY